VKIERMFVNIERMARRSSGCSLPLSGWREDRADARFHRADGVKIERMFASIEEV
jgi:hypothetical protein